MIKKKLTPDLALKLDELLAFVPAENKDKFKSTYEKMFAPSKQEAAGGDNIGNPKFNPMGSMLSGMYIKITSSITPRRKEARKRKDYCRNT